MSCLHPFHEHFNKKQYEHYNLKPSNYFNDICKFKKQSTVLYYTCVYTEARYVTSIVWGHALRFLLLIPNRMLNKRG